MEAGRGLRRARRGSFPSCGGRRTEHFNRRRKVLVHLLESRNANRTRRRAQAGLLEVCTCTIAVGAASIAELPPSEPLPTGSLQARHRKPT
ncbi:hypothetical protein NDU88_003702 [Pleurodeles waltl]|uniref:Uncharacterized protein n=1 Tax=Pleurodeles waltl TaxID=8319 RepID=A0AAV7SGQ7_PLEWA|nr:hypothetical protein NDU88_003702 [Pleurodeles waltl]